MKRKLLASAAASALLVTLGSVSLNFVSAFTPLTEPASAVACQFSTSRTLTWQVNVREGKSTSTRIIGTKRAGITLNFEAWEDGQAVNDAWTGRPDTKWYKLRGEAGWVASAVVPGYPPANCLNNSNSGNTNSKADQFFSWAIGQKGIQRRDRNRRNETLTWSDGQCVTLVLRYITDVFLNNNSDPRSYGHGKDMASGVASSLSSNFDGYTATGLPKRGAIISFNGPDTRWGHVGIVMEARWNNGKREIKMMESNHDGKGANSVVRIRDWFDISSSGYGRLNGWTNPKSLP
jgi:surface antigen